MLLPFPNTAPSGALPTTTSSVSYLLKSPPASTSTQDATFPPPRASPERPLAGPSSPPITSPDRRTSSTTPPPSFSPTNQSHPFPAKGMFFLSRRPKFARLPCKSPKPQLQRTDPLAGRRALEVPSRASISTSSASSPPTRSAAAAENHPHSLVSTSIPIPRHRNRHCRFFSKYWKIGKSGLSQTPEMGSQGPAPKRPFCDRCSKPARLCLCVRINLPQPLDNPITVTILQHSLETKHPLNSTWVAKIGLRNLSVVPVTDVNFHAQLLIRP